MKTLYFNDTENFIEHIKKEYEKYKTNEEVYFCGISIVAHYEIMCEIINTLIKNTDFRLYDIELENPDTDNYYNEWILTIDDLGEVWCEKAKRTSVYITTDSNIIFVHNDVSSKFIVENKRSNLIAFDIGEEDDFIPLSKCEENCCNKCNESVEYSKNDDGSLHGFSAARSDGNSYFGYTFYTSDDVSESFLKDILKEFGFTKK